MLNFEANPRSWKVGDLALYRPHPWGDGIPSHIIKVQDQVVTFCTYDGLMLEGDAGYLHPAPPMRTIIAGSTNPIHGGTEVAEIAVEQSCFSVGDVITAHDSGVAFSARNWARKNKRHYAWFSSYTSLEGAYLRMVDYAEALIAIPSEETEGLGHLVSLAKQRGLFVYIHKGLLHQEKKDDNRWTINPQKGLEGFYSYEDPDTYTKSLAGVRPPAVSDKERFLQIKSLPPSQGMKDLVESWEGIPRSQETNDLIDALRLGIERRNTYPTTEEKDEF